MSEPDMVRVCTFNCWGLKHVSKHREQRLRGIAQELDARSSKYDIIALQEVWVEDDFRYMREQLRESLPYSKFYYSGIISGPGLVAFSRWPIVETNLYRFPINGRPSAFYRGDWFVGKSVASAVILHPSGRKIEVLNCHMHAPYGPGDAAYTCHRTAQAWDMARIAKRATECGHFVMAVGDFNSIPTSLTYRLLSDVGGLSDAWLDFAGPCTTAMTDLTPEDQILLAGTTCDSVKNTWRENRQLHEAKRLDYIFYDHRMAEVVDCVVTFVEKLPGVGSLSDHFGIETTFRFTKESGTKIIKASELDLMYDEILRTIREYWPTALAQKKWRVLHFYASIVVLIGILVAMFWGALGDRAYVGFILCLMAIVVAVTGVVDGLIGFLFGRNETRALTEFENQIIMARDYLKLNITN